MEARTSGSGTARGQPRSVHTEPLGDEAMETRPVNQIEGQFLPREQMKGEPPDTFHRGHRLGVCQLILGDGLEGKRYHHLQSSDAPVFLA